MEQMLWLAVALLVMAGADIIAKLSKGKIPSSWVLMIVFILGFWTIFPSDILDKAGISTFVYNICAYFVMANMATTIPSSEMKRQWKTIIIALCGVFGLCAGGALLGVVLFGKELVCSTVPIFTGGMGAMMVLREASASLENPQIVVMALIASSVQFLIGLPLTSIMVRKEVSRLNNLANEGKLVEVESVTEVQRGWKPFLALRKFDTSAVLLCKVAVIALLATILSRFTGLSGLIFCLILGYIGSLTGFLEPNVLGKAGANGFCFTFMIMFLISGFAAAEPSVFFTYFLKILILGVIVTLGMLLMAFIVSKVFKKESFAMIFAIMLNCYHGFPLNAQIVDEAVENTVTNAEYKNVIASHVMPKMLIGGFTSVTVVSVFVATICASVLKAIM